jgi:hypothetical protein
MPAVDHGKVSYRQARSLPRRKDNQMPKQELPQKVYVAVGERVLKRMPWSEVCMHMNIADKMMVVEPQANGMAKLMDSFGNPFSAPITCGEAGLYFDENGFYFYPEEQ